MRELPPLGPIRALVLHEPTWIVSLHPAKQHRVVHRVPRLVPQTPTDDAGVILIPNHHPLHPIEHRRCEGVLAAYHVVVPVALDIRLVDNVQAQLIRHLVEIGVIGIVRGPDGIEIILFHQSQILEDFIEADGLSTCGTMIVSIHSLNQQGLAVDQKLSVGDFDVAESDGAIVHIFYCGSSSRASPDQSRT